jgi:hypothetical protein
LAVEQPPQEVYAVNNMMNGSWISLAFALVTMVTSSLWLPKKLVLQAIRTPSAIKLSHRGDLLDESEMQSRDTQTQYR